MAEDVGGDDNDGDDIVTSKDPLRHAGGLLVDDSVRIFDASIPEGEVRTVKEIIGEKQFRVDDLKNLYHAGFDSGQISERSAGWVKLPTKGEPEAFDIQTDLLKNAFGEGADGSDGGAFTEIEQFKEGNSFMPHNSNLGTGAKKRFFALIWSSHVAGVARQGIDNQVQYLAVDTSGNPRERRAGMSVQKQFGNWSYIFLGSIEDIYAGKPDIMTTTIRETTVHEMGHHWFPNAEDKREEHTGELNHLQKEICVMDNAPGPTHDGVVEFSEPDLYFIRKSDTQ